jgi:chromosome segregation ATPase
MSKVLETVGLLEDKLKLLLERYQFLKEENDILIENINKLQNKALFLEEEMNSEKEKYRLLKIAKTIDGSRSDSKETKQKINALIREIDKCIVKLNQ